MKPRTKAGTGKSAARERRLAFVHAYLRNGHNGLQAAITAGYSPKTAGQAAHTVLKDIEVQNIIRQSAKKAEESSGLSVERTLKEIARLAYYDPRKLYDEKGNLKTIPELDDDTAAGIAGLEVTEEFEGRGEEREMIGYTKKVKLADKNAALDKAMKFHGLYAADKVEHSGSIVFMTPEEVDAARQESLERVGDKAAKKAVK